MRRGLLRKLKSNRSPRSEQPCRMRVETREDGFQYIRPTPAGARK